MNDGEGFLELVAYVKASNHRVNILKFIEYDLKTPKEIGEALNVRTNHISKILAELKDHELVECINPEAHKGRLYRQTSKGLVVSRNLTTE